MTGEPDGAMHPIATIADRNPMKRITYRIIILPSGRAITFPYLAFFNGPIAKMRQDLIIVYDD
jgi:hypothetical protein